MFIFKGHVQKYFIICFYCIIKTDQNRLVMLVGNRFRQSLLTHTRLWYLVNAKDQINGRLAAYIATILQGKTKPIWHPKADVGDFLVVVNTKDIAFSGRKWDRKVYRHHTGIASSVECCFCPYGATLYIQVNTTQ